MIDTYDKGDVLRVTATYTTILGAAIDPTVVKVSYRDPDGNVVTYTYPTDAALVRSASGVYYTDIAFDQSGSWFVRHFSTGTGAAAAEKEYRVKQSMF